MAKVKLIGIDDHFFVLDQISHWVVQRRSRDPRRDYDPERIIIHLKSGSHETIECNNAVEVSNSLRTAFAGKID